MSLLISQNDAPHSGAAPRPATTGLLRRRPEKRGVPPRVRRGVEWLSLAYLAAIFATGLVLHFVSERWWLSSVLVFFPKLILLIPAIVLGLAAGVWHRRSLIWNGLAMAIVLVPIMGLVWNFSTGMIEPHSSNFVAGNVDSEDATAEPPRPLRVLSCNVQNFKPNFTDVLSEISVADPDIVAFQEAFAQPELLTRYFEKWQTAQVDGYFVASKFPMRMLATCEADPYNRTAALAVEIDVPDGTIVLVNVHQMTPRWGITDLSPGSIIRGDGPTSVERHVLLRDTEASLVRRFADSHARGRPLLLMGDFNTPSSSNLFQRTWGDFTNAFEVRGRGYGYTAPDRPFRRWFSHVPWVRIDHILASSHWSIMSCKIGKKHGSDHHLITATVRLSRNADRRE